MSRRIALGLVAVSAVLAAPAESTLRPGAGGAIVFASSKAAEAVAPAVYTIGIDGRGRRRITPNWRELSSPTWSPTGRWIAFQRDFEHSYVVPARGGRPLPIARRLATTDPTWSPDGSAIALSLQRERTESTDLIVARSGRWRTRLLVRHVGVAPAWLPDSRTLVYTRGGRVVRAVDVQTGRRRVLYKARLPLSAIALSPDGMRLLYGYMSPANGIYEIYLADLRSGRERRVARRMLQPSWSPDGRHFAAKRGGDVYVFSSDGRRRARVARDDYDETPATPPVWSPDGRWLAVAYREVYAVRSDGRGRIRVTHESPRFVLPFQDDASWSPDGTRLAYVSEKYEPPDLDLYAVPAAGGRTKVLTKNFVDEAAPAWSPDGMTLAFTQNRDQIGLLEPGGGPRILTSGRNPSWSPDGAQISFERAGDIYVMSRDGSNVRAVTSGQESDTEPAWSPDGLRIAFARETAEYKDIWSMATDGSDVVRITEVHRGRDFCVVLLASSPAWSPDGSEIAYSLLEGGNVSCALRGAWDSIHAVSADGAGRTRLITDGGRTDPTTREGAYKPAWSPDGTHLAFLDVLQEQERIAIVPREGGRFRFLTPARYRAVDPSWRP
jgi:Tol biopolymer transport system component